MSASDLEALLAFQLRALKAPEHVAEYRFAAEHVGGAGKGLRARLAAAKLKDWRFDFAWPDLLLAVEIEGGSFVGGRHTRGAGFEADTVKYGEAQLLGWNVYRCGTTLVRSGRAAEMIVKLIEIQERRHAA
jgi:hypothetical protein